MTGLVISVLLTVVLLMLVASILPGLRVDGRDLRSWRL